MANALSIGLVTPGQPTLQFANVAGLPGSTPDEIVFSGITLVGDSLGFSETPATDPRAELNAYTSYHAGCDGIVFPGARYADAVAAAGASQLALPFLADCSFDGFVSEAARLRRGGV